MRPAGLILAVAVLLLAACGGSDAGAAPDGASPPGAPVSPSATTTDFDFIEDSEPLQVAKDDLVRRLEVPVGDVEVAVQEEVTWRDGSLGCANAGEAYTQVLTDGYRIVLNVAGNDYHYHGAAGEEPVYCADPSEDATVSGGGGG